MKKLYKCNLLWRQQSLSKVHMTPKQLVLFHLLFKKHKIFIKYKVLRDIIYILNKNHVWLDYKYIQSKTLSIQDFSFEGTYSKNRSGINIPDALMIIMYLTMASTRFSWHDVSSWYLLFIKLFFDCENERHRREYLSTNPFRIKEKH